MACKARRLCWYSWQSEQRRISPLQIPLRSQVSESLSLRQKYLGGLVENYLILFHPFAGSLDELHDKLSRWIIAS